MDSAESSLRRRKEKEGVQTEQKEIRRDAVGPEAAEAKEPHLGKTSDGVVFIVPPTHPMVTLFSPSSKKSPLDILTLLSLSLQFILFAYFSRTQAQYFFLFYFAAWRLAYNAGLGWVLKGQSETKSLVRWVRRGGWLDVPKEGEREGWWIKELKIKLGEGYDYKTLPLEFNVWILFRHSVDIILLNDFLSYFLFGLSHLNTAFSPAPLSATNQTTFLVTLRWIGGLMLIGFNLWVKVDAHRIVKDFAWYWGDAFFMSMENLVFDGVFEFAPHPMYSVGYAGYYGLSLIVGSELVLFVSLAAHACQFGFLLWFENPHIERTYGEKKPLAARTPLHPPTLIPTDLPPKVTPATVSSGESSSSGTEEWIPTTRPTSSVSGDSISPSRTRESSIGHDPQTTTGGTAKKSKIVTRHDLDNRYFQKDLVLGIKNFDFFRSRDFSFLLVLLYGLALTFLPSLSSPTLLLSVACLHALLWRGFHTFILGMVLKKQSEGKWLVRHFLKGYLYDDDEGEEGGGGAVRDAWDNWKAIYNMSLGMTYVSFVGLAWRCYTIPVDWTVGTIIVRHTLGALLILLHVWTAQSTYEVLGPFGWFYGDFFIEDYPAELYYTGIYRFLNNPERSMGGAAFFGFALICGSKLMLAQAVIAVMAHWWFLSVVENPHMKKLYGDKLRQEAGVTKTLRGVVDRNAHVLPGGLGRGVREVQGTFEKVFDETAEAVEEFLNRSAPTLAGYVQDTKILLQQSGERMVISRVAGDLAKYDQTRYSLSLQPSLIHGNEPSTSTSTTLKFHLGEPISINWTAPHNHSRKDWIGIYRLGANKSQLVTKVSSQGHWLGVNRNEWEGDQYDENFKGAEKAGKMGDEAGTAKFSGKRLPWAVGSYELRYHHDGKHSVLAISTPIEIFVKHATNPEDSTEIYTTLSEIVAQVLEFDPSVIPASTHHLIPSSTSYQPTRPRRASSAASTNHEKSTPLSLSSSTSINPITSTNSMNAMAQLPNLSDQDDFVIYTMEDAEHIAYAIKIAFEVELGREVVCAAANVRKLVGRIVGARKVLLKGRVGSGGSAKEK